MVLRLTFCLHVPFTITSLCGNPRSDSRRNRLEGAHPHPTHHGEGSPMGSSWPHRPQETWKLQWWVLSGQGSPPGWFGARGFPPAVLPSAAPTPALGPPAWGSKPFPALHSPLVVVPSFLASWSDPDPAQPEDQEPQQGAGREPSARLTVSSR